MPTASCTVVINAPPARVFEVFTDLANAPTRVSAIKRLELLTPGPVGMGTRFRETRVMLGKEATETMEITAFDPPRSYIVGANSCGARYEMVLRFTPESGGTRVDMNFSATPVSFFAKLMSPLSGMMMKQCAKAMNKDCAELKAAAEAA